MLSLGWGQEGQCRNVIGSEATCEPGCEPDAFDSVSPPLQTLGSLFYKEFFGECGYSHTVTKEINTMVFRLSKTS